MATVRQNTLITKKNDDDTYKVYSTNSRVSPSTAPATAVRSEYAPKPVQNTIREEYAPKPVENSNNYSQYGPGGGEYYSNNNTSVSYDRMGFTPSSVTNRYLDRLTNLEDNQPGSYVSAYEDQIADILDTIYNRQAFDVKNDSNYTMLRDQYQQMYENQARKAMNDSMASANAMTGGYGSTYGSVAGQQAYDSTMENMNSRNVDLMNMAYNMYRDDVNNDYKKLGAYQGQDSIEYGRYRDDVGDYYRNLDYYSGQYNNGLNSDYQIYSNDRAFNKSVTDTEYQKYQDAMNQAVKLASAGLTVPDSISRYIDYYNTANGLSSTSSADYLKQLSAESIANKSKSKASGGSGSNKVRQEYGEDDEMNIANDSNDKTVYVAGIGDVSWKKVPEMLKSGQLAVVGDGDILDGTTWLVKPGMLQHSPSVGDVANVLGYQNQMYSGSDSEFYDDDEKKDRTGYLRKAIK